jgi:hypothetical protein
MPSLPDLHVRWKCAWMLAALAPPLLWCSPEVSGSPPPGVCRFDDTEAAEHIPAQQEYSPAPDPGVPPTWLERGDPRAADCIVRDVSSTPEGSGWRWTYLKPVLKFHLADQDRRRFTMDFTIVDTAFRSTGPVTLTCVVNDRLLARLHCPRPGNYHLERDVPQAWLTPDPVIVQATLDKVWTAPADGARLGYVLVRAGFGH